MPGHRRKVSQSAMEYLMTYGWAILIIAVVLGALYSLGVFNAVNFMPKVPGGGCHVFRPNGPGTSWNVNLVGSCNNALPQYVAQFNGQSSYIDAGNPTYLNFGTDNYTISAWFDESSYVTNGYSAIVGKSSSNSWATSYGIQLYNNSFFILTGLGSWYAGINPLFTSVSPSLNAWHYVVVSLDRYGNLVLYLDGASVYTKDVSSANGVVISNNYNLRFGREFTDAGSYTPFQGGIANVQIYNTSLTANQVQYLYGEGIGGVPISPQYLVGWWPLNGDMTDYSGNNNNGVPTNVIFNGTWTGGYTPP